MKKLNIQRFIEYVIMVIIAAIIVGINYLTTDLNDEDPLIHEVRHNNHIFLVREGCTRGHPPMIHSPDCWCHTKIK